MVGGFFTLTCFPFIKTHVYFFCISALASFLARFCAEVSFLFTFAMACDFSVLISYYRSRYLVRPVGFLCANVSVDGRGGE